MITQVRSDINSVSLSLASLTEWVMECSDYNFYTLEMKCAVYENYSHTTTLWLTDTFNYFQFTKGEVGMALLASPN